MFKGFLKRVLKGILDDSSFSALTGGGTSTPLSSGASTAQLMHNFKNWVYVCVDKISDTLSGLQLELRKYNKKGDDVELDDHKVLSVLAKPNRAMTGRDFMYTIASHLELTGNAYILKDKEKNPDSLFPLNPASVRMVMSDNHTQVVSYAYTAGTKQFVYPVELIIHIKYPNPSNPLKGSGTLEHIADWVDVDSAATEFNRLFFVNNASPAGHIETDATDEKAMMLSLIGWEQRHKGVNNSHKTAVLPKGAKYVSDSATPNDMQFSEMDNRFRDKILSAFGVPKSVVGIVEDVNRANAEASNYVFMAFTIKPKIERIISYLNEWLLPSFTGTEQLYFCAENFIPENDDLRLRENQVALAGQSWETINEVRSREGMPPIENGDFVYGGFATVPIGKPVIQQENNIEPVVKGKKVLPPRLKDGIKKEKAIDDILDMAEKALVSVAKKTQEELDEVAHKQFITRVSKYESQFVSTVKKFDKALEEKVIENLKDEKAYNVKALFNASQAEQLFMGITMPVLQDLLKTEGQAQMERLDTGVPFNPLNENIQNKLKKLLNLTAQSYTGTTLNLLNNSLQEGISNGESLSELTSRVGEVFSLTDQYRAERVAKTTVFGTANASAREAYEQSGIVTEVKWHTAEDEMVCEFCGPLNGETVSIDEDFFEQGSVVTGRDGGRLPIDFNNVEDPPLHPNCRCFTNAVVETIKDSIEVPDTKEEDADTKFLEDMVKALEGNE